MGVYTTNLQNSCLKLIFSYFLQMRKVERVGDCGDDDDGDGGNGDVREYCCSWR